MSDGGSIEINCGSGGSTGCGGDVTITGGPSEKELIENNPCWPYSAGSKSELELCLDALEPLEQRENFELLSNGCKLFKDFV